MDCFGTNVDGKKKYFFSFISLSPLTPWQNHLTAAVYVCGIGAGQSYDAKPGPLVGEEEQQVAADTDKSTGNRAGPDAADRNAERNSGSDRCGRVKYIVIVAFHVWVVISVFLL